MNSHDSITTINNVRILPSRGPWLTKSGGQLRQRFQIPLLDVQSSFLTFPNDPDVPIPDIRGLRLYTVDNIPQGTIGANEFHKVRTDIAIAQAGSFKWVCTDVFGNTQTFTIDQSQALLVPPMILHTYESLSDKGGLIILASTIFEPGDAHTHDSYSAELFQKMVSQNTNN